MRTRGTTSANPWRRLSCAAAMLILTGCARGQGSSPPRPQEHPEASNVFRDVVVTIQDSAATLLKELQSVDPAGASRYEIRIDPRPFELFPLELESMRWPSDEELRAAPAAIVQSRSEVLARQGIARGDMNDLDRCPGTMAAFMPERRCPDRPVLIALLSSPVAAGRRTTVQVILVASDTRTKTGLMTTYDMEPHQGRWQLVARGLTVMIE